MELKAINLNKYEYYAPDHRTRKAYRMLIDERNKLIWNQLYFYEYIERVEQIIFNYIPVKDLKYFNNNYYLILKLLTASIEAPGALYHLKTDLLTVY